jgi:hypothetical protein
MTHEYPSKRAERLHRASNAWQLLATLDRWPPFRLSSWTEPHWACESCGQPCTCEIPDLPHVACGLVDHDWRGSA